MEIIGKTKLIFAALALIVLVISLAECMKRTQYHEQVSFEIHINDDDDDDMMLIEVT